MIVPECIEWQGTVSSYGYAVMWCGKDQKQYRVARIIAEAQPGQQVHHTCNNKLCANKDHLILVEPGEHRKLYHAPEQCVKCGASDWYYHSEQRHCRPCRNKSAGAYQKAHPEKHREAQRKYLERKGLS